MRSAERWSEHTKRLPPLTTGDYVRNPNWTPSNQMDKTGRVVEVRQFDQHVVREDGSGRMTVRNRKFLRKFVSVHLLPLRLSITDDLRYRKTSADTEKPITTPPPSKIVPHHLTPWAHSIAIMHHQPMGLKQRYPSHLHLHLVGVFEDTNLCAIHAKRVTNAYTFIILILNF